MQLCISSLSIYSVLCQISAIIVRRQRPFCSSLAILIFELWSMIETASISHWKLHTFKIYGKKMAFVRVFVCVCRVNYQENFIKFFHQRKHFADHRLSFHINILWILLFICSVCAEAFKVQFSTTPFSHFNYVVAIFLVDFPLTFNSTQRSTTRMDFNGLFSLQFSVNSNGTITIIKHCQ